MALEMRNTCERCTGSIDDTSVAYICAHECTYCSPCTEELNNVCPNCGGELVKRPRMPQNACPL